MQARDEDHNDGKELKESHANQGVREEVLLHRWIACHADDKGSEELAYALSAATHRHHRDGAAQHRDSSMALCPRFSQPSWGHQLGCRFAHLLRTCLLHDG